jgi:chaperonin GroES
MTKKKTKGPSFQPLHDNVLIEKDTVDAEEKKTPGGLYVPQASRKAPNTATVVAVGPDVKGLKTGDVVVVGTFSGTNVVVHDEDLVVIRFEDVLGLYQ